MKKENICNALVAITFILCISLCIQVSDLKNEIRRTEQDVENAVSVEVNRLRADMNSKFSEVYDDVKSFQHKYLSFDLENKKVKTEISFSLKEYTENTKILVKIDCYGSDGEGYELIAKETEFAKFSVTVDLSTAHNYRCRMYDVSNGVRELSGAEPKGIYLNSDYESRVSVSESGRGTDNIRKITNVSATVENNTLGNTELEAEKAELTVYMAEEAVYSCQVEIQPVSYENGIQKFHVSADIKDSVPESKKNENGAMPEPRYVLKLTFKNGETQEINI